MSVQSHRVVDVALQGHRDCTKALEDHRAATVQAHPALSAIIPRSPNDLTHAGVIHARSCVNVAIPNSKNDKLNTMTFLKFFGLRLSPGSAVSPSPLRSPPQPPPLATRPLVPLPQHTCPPTLGFDPWGNLIGKMKNRNKHRGILVCTRPVQSPCAKVALASMGVCVPPR